MTSERKPHRETDEGIANILDHIRPDFVETGAKRIGAEDVARVVSRAHELRRAFAESGTLQRFRNQAELMISLVQDYHDRRYLPVSYWTIAVAAFTLLYVLKPVDIIPDTLPVIGKLDDAVVVSHCFAFVGPELEAYRRWKLTAAP